MRCESQRDAVGIHKGVARGGSGRRGRVVGGARGRMVEHTPWSHTEGWDIKWQESKRQAKAQEGTRYLSSRPRLQRPLQLSTPSTQSPQTNAERRSTSRRLVPDDARRKTQNATPRRRDAATRGRRRRQMGSAEGTRTAREGAAVGAPCPPGIRRSAPAAAPAAAASGSVGFFFFSGSWPFLGWSSLRRLGRSFWFGPWFCRLSVSTLTPMPTPVGPR